MATLLESIEEAVVAVAENDLKWKRMKNKITIIYPLTI